MILEPTTVKDNKGNVVPAQIAKCDVCGGDVFHITVVKEHNHIQCANPFCGEVYCQGGCEANPPEEMENAHET